VQALLRNPVLCAPVALVLAIFLRAAERVAVGTPQDGAGFAGEFKTTLCVGHDGSGGFASTSTSHFPASFKRRSSMCGKYACHHKSAASSSERVIIASSSLWFTFKISNFAGDGKQA
jgi:hypothetical protein